MNESILYGIILLAALVCTYRAMVASRILSSAIWLAGVSALVSITLYLLGAYQVAAIELSVGAGLVTVLMVYAISVVGDDAFDPQSLIPRWLAILLTLAATGMLVWLSLPLQAGKPAAAGNTLVNVLWEQRVLDVWIQIVLIFSGVMGMLGLLAEGKTRPRSGLQTLTEVMGAIPQSPSGLKATDVLLDEQPVVRQMTGAQIGQDFSAHTHEPEIERTTA